MIRRTENAYENLLSRGYDVDEDLKDREKIGYGEIAFQSKSIKTKFATVVTISSVIVFEFIVLSFQYLDISLDMSRFWNDSIEFVKDKFHFLTLEFDGVGYIIWVTIVSILNIVVLSSVLLSVFFKWIKIDLNSK